MVGSDRNKVGFYEWECQRLFKDGAPVSWSASMILKMLSWHFFPVRDIRTDQIPLQLVHLDACGTSGAFYTLVLVCIGMPCIMSCLYRTKIRSRFNLVETPAPDWVHISYANSVALLWHAEEIKISNYQMEVL